MSHDYVVDVLQLYLWLLHGLYKDFAMMCNTPQATLLLSLVKHKCNILPAVQVAIKVIHTSIYNQLKTYFIGLINSNSHVFIKPLEYIIYWPTLPVADYG